MRPPAKVPDDAGDRRRVEEAIARHGLQSSCNVFPVAMTVAPMMMRMLKMADPTMVPTPRRRRPACGEARRHGDEAELAAPPRPPP